MEQSVWNKSTDFGLKFTGNLCLLLFIYPITEFTRNLNTSNCKLFKKWKWFFPNFNFDHHIFVIFMPDILPFSHQNRICEDSEIVRISTQNKIRVVRWRGLNKYLLVWAWTLFTFSSYLLPASGRMRSQVHTKPSQEWRNDGTFRFL